MKKGISWSNTAVRPGSNRPKRQIKMVDIKGLQGVLFLGLIYQTFCSSGTCTDTCFYIYDALHVACSNMKCIRKCLITLSIWDQAWDLHAAVSLKLNEADENFGRVYVMWASGCALKNSYTFLRSDRTRNFHTFWQRIMNLNEALTIKTRPSMMA